MKYIKRIEKPKYKVGEKFGEYVWDEKSGQKFYRVVKIRIKRYRPLNQSRETRQDYFYTLECPYCGNNFETNDVMCGFWPFHQEECIKSNSLAIK